jgi:hypothetical protein
VRADQTRNGIGSLLLGDVVRRYGQGLTLLTFSDVPWNGPGYLRHGFAELPRSARGPELRRHWQAAVDAGLHDLGPRLVMHFAANSPGRAAASLLPIPHRHQASGSSSVGPRLRITFCP